MHDSMTPQYTTTLIGRSHETAQILALLNDPSIRLITLTGTSGTGKTRLSMEVVAALSQADQPVVFIPLAAITNPELVLPTIAQHLQIRESSTLSVLPQLTSYFENNPITIILDNFEQVLSANEEIAKLLEQTTALTILITSQETLNIATETVYIIPGLAMPPSPPSTIEEALEYAAIQLFIERIKKVQPSLEFNLPNLLAITEICAMLEGLPLAIELVAAHSEVLPPRDLRMLVHQHLMLYRFRAKRATGRQRIILPIIEWSLLRLPEAAQAVFQHLGCFKGGWQVEALEHVIQDPTHPIESTLDQLVARHLILKQDVQGTAVRYMMLDAVQDYADKQFNQLASTIRQQSITRHMDYMTTLMHSVHICLINHDQTTQIYWMNRATQEMPNIRFLLDWAITNTPNTAISLANNLGRFWYIGGYWKEASLWFSQILAQATTSAQEQGQLLSHYSLILTATGKYAEAETIGKSALDYAEQAQDIGLQSRINNSLGLIMLNTQVYDKAKVFFEQSLQQAKAAGLDSLIPMVIGNLANIELNQNNLESALARYLEVEQLTIKAQQPLPELYALINIGSVYLAQRKPLLAIAAFDNLLPKAQALQAREVYAVTINYKAQALLLHHNPHVSSLLYESITMLRDLGSTFHLYSAIETSIVALERNARIPAAGYLAGAIDRLIEEHGLATIENSTNPALADMFERVTNNQQFISARKEGYTWTTETLIAYTIEQLTELKDHEV